MIYPAESKLSGAITAAATSLTLVSGAGFSAAPFHLVIEGEIVLCPTLPAGNVVTGITRGVLGTVAAAHNDQTGAYGLFSKAFQRSAMGGLGGYWDQIAAQLDVLQGNPLSPSNGGSNFLWNNFALTGVAFSQSTVTLTGGSYQTVATNATANKRLMVQIYVVNLTGSAATYSYAKSNGTLIFPLNNGIALAAGAVASVFMLLEPGESALALAATTAVFAQVQIMSFDLSNGLKTVTLWGGFALGNNLLYTCPAGVTAFWGRWNSTPQGFNSTSTLVGIQNFDTLSITYILSVGAVQVSPTLTLAPGSTTTAIGEVAMLPIMTSGQTLTLNTSADNTGNSIFTGFVWERPN